MTPRTHSSFHTDERAAVSILLVGLVSLMVMCMILALDATRLYILQNRLDAALYAGALAGGTTARFVAMAESLEAMEQGETEIKVTNIPEIEDAARRFFQANFPPGFMGAEVQGPHVGQGMQQEMKIVAHVSWRGLMGKILRKPPTVLKAEHPIIRYGKDLPLLAGKIKLR